MRQSTIILIATLAISCAERRDSGALLGSWGPNGDCSYPEAFTLFQDAQWHGEWERGTWKIDDGQLELELTHWLSDQTEHWAPSDGISVSLEIVEKERGPIMLKRKGRAEAAYLKCPDRQR